MLSYGERKNSHWFRKFRLVKLTSVLGKIIKQILLDTILRHSENREVTGDSQYSLIKGKSCLTNLVMFYDRVVDKERAEGVIYLTCGKCVTLPHIASLFPNCRYMDLIDESLSG